MSSTGQTPKSDAGFFKNLAKRQGMSMGGCALGLLFGLFLAYQVLSFAVWLAGKVLGFGAVAVCSRCPMNLAMTTRFMIDVRTRACGHASCP
ncbi:MAG: hypothetical protein ACPIOQ_42695 [Promethearchaeia archaeon]